jgi:Xaa-Pro dipeptidase
VAGSAGTPDFGFLKERLDSIQAALVEQRLAGWLLYDLRGRNAVAQALTGLGELSRRTFVLIPAQGEPVAVTHAIEQGPWAAWPWQRRRYSGWQELDAALASVLPGGGRIAMEYSPDNAVPVMDLVPAGVMDRVRARGVEVVSSGELVTRFHSRWSAEGLASHRRSAIVLAQTAQAAFAELARRVRHGAEATEGGMRTWILEHLAGRGVGVDADCIMARGINAANPHYAPGPRGEAFAEGDVVLLDLWGRESADAVVADQTWMGYLGAEVPERPAALFEILREARDAAVEHVRAGWAAGRTMNGGEIDDVARDVIRRAGYGERFIHRTGHSIDRATHGMGPNIDNFETRELRTLIAGIGFSIEPGIYIPGEIGLRSEIDVYLGADGPEVTTPAPQQRITPLLGG